MTASEAAGGEFRWGVRESFIAYLELMPDSIIELDGCTRIADPTRFVFPENKGVTDASARHYTGRVRFEAHGGMLALSLADPRVHLDGTTAAVSFQQPDGTRIVVAEIANLVSIDSVWSGAAVLSREGEALFGGSYGAGDALDPVEFTSGR